MAQGQPAQNEFHSKKIRCRSERRVGKSAQRCAHVSVDADCESDLGTLRFALPTLSSLAVAQKGHSDRLTAIRKRRRIGRIYFFSLFFQEKTFAPGFLLPILRLTRRCRTY